MKRLVVYAIINEKRLSAEIEVEDGEVVAWQPLTLNELNANIDKCIDFLKDIKSAMERSRQ